MPAQLSRRAVLAGLTGVAGVAVAACTRPAKRQPADAAQIVVANYPVYIDATTNPRFTQQTGIAVEYRESAHPDAVVGTDVMVVSDWVVPVGSAQVPWMTNMVGLATSSNLATTVSTFAELFRRELAGRVVLPLDLRQSLGIALLADRVDPAIVTLEQATATATRLANSVRLGQVRFADRPLDSVLAGEADAAVASAGAVVGHPEDLEFAVPDEGGLVFRDVAVITEHAANPDGAQAYLDFISDPTNAAERFRVIPGLWDPNGRLEAVLRRDGPQVLDDPRRNPSPEVRARLRPFRVLTAREEEQFDALFDEVVHAAG